MRAFYVDLNGKNIDTVFYANTDPITEGDVKRSLVDHDGYDSNIVVRETKDTDRAITCWRKVRYCQSKATEPKLVQESWQSDGLMP